MRADSTKGNPFLKKPIPVPENDDGRQPSRAKLETGPAAPRAAAAAAAATAEEEDPLSLSTNSAASVASSSSSSNTRRRSRHTYTAIMVADDDLQPQQQHSPEGTANQMSHFEIDGTASAAASAAPDGGGQSRPSEANGASEAGLERHLSLRDLIAVGVGGTIGSGLFVLAGLVANRYAGPSTVISWAVSGFAACLSGCCYAELSGRIPLSGGCYAYTYVALGELFAVVSAACLSLEYVAAASAVARSWGDKCVEWMEQELGDEHWIHDYLGTTELGPFAFSPLALVVSGGAVILLLNGVKESKRATNLFTSLKVLVVMFMIVVGCFYVSPKNWSPFIPPAFGVKGIFRGATGTFFGYLVRLF